MSALLDIVLDGLRAAPGAQFTLDGLGGELYALGLLMVTSGDASRRVCATTPLRRRCPIVVLAAFPLLQVVHALPRDRRRIVWPGRSSASGSRR